MNETQRSAAERLADAVMHPEAAALLRELAAGPVVNQQMTTEPAQEPVAWHVCSVNSDGSLSLEFAAPWEEAAHEHINDAINEYDIDDAASWVVRPVYASPQPQRTEPPYAAPQQRKPLSADQIRDAVNDHAFWATSKNFIFRIARAIERAHGITGEQK